MPIVVNEKTTFAAGEIQPALWYARHLARHQTGLKRLENMVVLKEGGATRRPGTRFAAPYKTESQKGKLVPFRFSGSDNYALAMNGGKMRVLKDGGILETVPGTPFELTIPWVEADLPSLRWAEFGNDVYFVCKGVKPQKLTRAGHTSWSIADYQSKGGPVELQNLDTTKTIQASAVTGSVTLTAAGHTPFAAGHVGSVWRLDEPSLLAVPLWKPGEIVMRSSQQIDRTLGTNIGTKTGGGGLAAAFDGNINKAFGSCADGGLWMGKDYGAGTPKTVSRVRVYGSNDQGFVSTTGNPSLRYELRASNSSPTTGLEGVVLGSLQFTDTSDERSGRDIFSTDPVTAYRYVWIYHQFDTSNGHDLGFAQIEVYSLIGGDAKAKRRYLGRVYEAECDGDAAQNPPVHEEGDQQANGDGIVWRYLHNGRGYVQITAFTDSSHVTGTVLAQANNIAARLPDSVVDTATYRWFEGAWSGVRGWPEQISLLANGQLVFERGDKVWRTRPSDPTDFDITTTDDTGLALRIPPQRGSVVQLEWAYGAGIILLGGRDDELALRAPGAFDAITPTTMRLVPQSSEGSAPHVPEMLDGGLIFIGRSRERQHYAEFDYLAERLSIDEITLYSGHLFKGRAAGLAWQKDPHRVLWCRNEDGTLVGLTFMPKEKVLAGHRHPMVNGIVEDIIAIPTSDEAVSEVYLGIKRTINGSTRRYYERLQPFFKPQQDTTPYRITGATRANPVVLTVRSHPWSNGQKIRIKGVVGMTELNGLVARIANKTAHTIELEAVNGSAFTPYERGGKASRVATAEGAWFVDCALAYSGAAATVISGLGHLEAELVRVFSAGRWLGDFTVAAGAITLPQAVTECVVGLPVVWSAIKLPEEIESQAGTSKGKKKAAMHAIVDLNDAAGGEVFANNGAPEPVTVTGAAGYGDPIELEEGSVRLDLGGESDINVEVEISGDNPLPFTLLGLSTELDVRGS